MSYASLELDTGGDWVVVVCLNWMKINLLAFIIDIVNYFVYILRKN